MQACVVSVSSGSSLASLESHGGIMGRLTSTATIRAGLAGLLALALVSAGIAPASASPGSTTLVSLTDADTAVVDGAFEPIISGDGTVVVFIASEPGVVPGVSGQHLFARDRSTGTTVVVDALPDGSLTTGSLASVSHNGRYVAFEATLYDGGDCPAPPAEGNRDCREIFRRDLQSGTTELVSVAADGQRSNDYSTGPAISADGSRVLFESVATDLGPQGSPDGALYVRDLLADSTQRVDLTSDEQPGDGYSYGATLSADGAHVAFSSGSTNLGQGSVFVRNLDTGETAAPFDFLPSPVQAFTPFLDATAEVLAFTTADPLLPEDVDADSDIYVLDRDTDDLSVIDPDAFAGGSAPQLSDDGRFVGFFRERHTPAPVSRGYWVHDRVTGTTTLESVRSDGSAVDNPQLSFRQAMSSDAGFVTFYTNDAAVTSDDPGSTYDAFVHARSTPAETASGTGEASTDGGSGPSVGDPMDTSVAGANGAVAIEELGADDPDALPLTGYAVLGQQVKITAGATTPPDFLTITFDLDGSIVPASEGPESLTLLREGVALSDCALPSDRGPCVANKSVLPSGDWRVVAHSPQASVWAVAVELGETPAPDTTDPTVQLVTPDSGASYVEGASVTVDYSCADMGGAGLFSCAGDLPDGALLDTSTPGEFDFEVTATDRAGNNATASADYTVTAAQDTVSPEVSMSSPAQGAVYTLGQSVVASYSCSDSGGSELESCAGDVPTGSPINTQSIGSKTFRVTAVDNAGNSTVRAVAYSVVWPLTAFLAPVDNPPMVNTVKAGKTVPVRFSLGGNRGMNVFAPGYPRVVTVACPGGVSTDEIESVLNGRPPALSYANGTYTYALATESKWASSTMCRQLQVRWLDGSERTALFRLR